MSYRFVTEFTADRVAADKSVDANGKLSSQEPAIGGDYGWQSWGHGCKDLFSSSVLAWLTIAALTA